MAHQLGPQFGTFFIITGLQGARSANDASTEPTGKRAARARDFLMVQDATNAPFLFLKSHSALENVLPLKSHAVVTYPFIKYFS